MSLPDLDRPWALGRAAFAEIVAWWRHDPPRRILEFGSGASTVHLARAFPEAEIWSWEHDAGYAEEVRRLLEGAGCAERVHLRVRPLRFLWYGGALYYGYAPEPLPGPVDAVLVDGPPYWTGFGREAALYAIARWLRPGVRVVLDDHARPVETTTVAHWLNRGAGGWRAEVRRVGHGLAFLTLVGERPFPRRLPARERNRVTAGSLRWALRRGYDRWRRGR